MYIYKITNLLNNQFYIGQSLDYRTRWATHIRSSYTGFEYSDIDRSKVKRFEIICDNKYTFKSLAEAMRYFGIGSNREIVRACKGEIPSACGHIWRYGKQLN